MTRYEVYLELTGTKENQEVANALEARLRGYMEAYRPGVVPLREVVDASTLFRVNGVEYLTSTQGGVSTLMLHSFTAQPEAAVSERQKDHPIFLRLTYEFAGWEWPIVNIAKGHPFKAEVMISTDERPEHYTPQT